MLRINLLPAYVAQRRVTRMLLAVYGTILIVLLVVIGGFYGAIAPMDDHYKYLADQAAAAKAAVDAVNTQASTVTSSIGPIQQKLDFVNAVHDYNKAFPKLFEEVAQYTSPKILYNSMSLSGTSLTITGYTPSLNELGKYLIEMYKEPDASAVALATAIPGYGAAAPSSVDSESIPAPAVGKLPGYPLPVYSYTVTNGKITAVNSGGGTSGPTGFGGIQGPQGMPMGQMGRMGPMGAMAMGGAAGETTGKVFDPRKDGFPFTVVLTMKTVPAPPTPPETPVVITVGGAGGGGQFGPGGPQGFRGGGPPMGMGGPMGGPPAGMGGPPAGMGGPPAGMGGPPHP
jgi:Tfp pilus assembly protein PilN